MGARKSEIDTVSEIYRRDRVIIRTSIIGIIANVLLAIFKAIIGLISNSIAVVLDAINNLSDALSSIITIVGTKLASKAPNKKHPLGYGRIEYVTALIVAAIVLYAGITSGYESIKKIITPEESDYGIVALIIIAAAVLVKFFLGRYVKKQGEKVNSGSLIASGSDATMDAILSASVLASAIIYLVWHISLEAYVGVVIAIFIIKAGIDMVRETLDEILGNRPSKELTDEIKEILCEDERVRGAYDLSIYNFGPDKNYASVHLEIPDTMSAVDIDLLTRQLEMKVYEETGVIITGLGIYSYNTGSNEAARIESRIRDIVTAHDWVLQMHGFYIDEKRHFVRFDAVLSFDIKPKEGIKILCDELKEAYPEYTFFIVPDIDLYDI